MVDAEIQARREAFIEELLSNNYSTYFVATHPKYSRKNDAFRFTSQPVSMAVPHHWNYADARQRLLELGQLLTPEEAERRNVNYVNPAMKEMVTGATLPTLRGGIQLLAPSERAYSHRHSANAFRLIQEAPPKGAYTVVEGYKLPMFPGDLILTPNWTWHDHHNEGESHAIWYDGLDAVLAFWIGAGFFESLNEVSGTDYQTHHAKRDAVWHRYGTGLLTSGSIYPDHIPASNNGLLYYPYQKVRTALDDLARQGFSDPQDGIALEYVNPINGGPSFPTMRTDIRLVPPETQLESVRRTENLIFIALEGGAVIDVGDGKQFQVQPYDVVAIPSWIPYRVSNPHREPAVLFSYSDRPLFRQLGFYRDASQTDSE